MVIITTRDTHRLATYSEKELGIGSIASDWFPIDAFGGVETREGSRRWEKQLARFLGSSRATVGLLILLPWPSTHLGFSSSSIHSQSDGESTANDMDFKEGAKEVAAAQSNHLLWDKGRIRR